MQNKSEFAQDWAESVARRKEKMSSSGCPGGQPPYSGEGGQTPYPPGPESPGYPHDPPPRYNESPRPESRRPEYSYGSNTTSGIKSLNQRHDNLFEAEGELDEEKCHVEDRKGHGNLVAGSRATDHKNGHYSSEAYFGLVGIKDGDDSWGRSEASADAELGVGGAIAEAGVSGTIFAKSNQDGVVEVGKAELGGGLGAGPGGVKAKVDAGVDLVRARGKIGENQEIKANLGLNANTGGEVGVDGVSATFLGWGGSIGRETGIATPFGGLSLKLW